jgi:exopolyphosphatase/guanosine-5'-triphosphate,3'-diphosphate pyrophosphatase
MRLLGNTMRESEFSNTSIHCGEHHPVIGAIDLGTNSCRLLLAAVNVAGLSKSPYRARIRPNILPWRIIDSFGKIVRLGEGLHKNNELSEEAIDRAIEALRMCYRKIEQHDAKYLRAVATEACRRSTNAHVLAKRAENELGLRIEIISGQEEARLALTGCAGVMNSKIPYGLLFDIGGGSTEVILIKLNNEGHRRPGYPTPFEVIDSVSMPYGVVMVSESHGGHESSDQTYVHVRAEIALLLHAFAMKHKIPDLIHRQEMQLVGSSGTVTTLAAIKLGLPKYDRRYVDGIEIDVASMMAISRDILRMTASERAVHPCIGKGREDLVVVGSAILDGILEAFPVQKLSVADRGVREGILVELLTHINRKSIYARH